MITTEPDTLRRFGDLAAQVAIALGPGWSAEHGSGVARHATLRGPDQQCLHLAHGDDSHRRSEHGRIRITTDYGDLARHLNTDEGRHHITVTAARTAAAIAAEITRRLLPEHQALLTRCRDRARDEDLARTRRASLLTELHHLLAPATPVGADRLRFGSVDDPVSGDLRVRYSGHVDLKLALTAELALELAHALGRYRQRDTY